MYPEFYPYNDWATEFASTAATVGYLLAIAGMVAVVVVWVATRDWE